MSRAPVIVPHEGPTEPRAVVTWEGVGEPIVLRVYGPAGEVAVPLVPKRALTLAQELLTRGVQAIKADWPGTTLPRRGPDLGLRADSVRLVDRA